LCVLKPKQTVRIETNKGFGHLAQVVGKAERPRSYLVESEGRLYERNRKHLLPVKEKIPVQVPETMVPMPQVHGTPRRVPQVHGTPRHEAREARTPPVSPGGSPSTSTPAKSSEPPMPPVQEKPVVTRSGRCVKPNSKFADYETY
jgi:uncharacterized protein YbaR (Trm112 family)